MQIFCLVSYFVWHVPYVHIHWRNIVLNAESFFDLVTNILGKPESIFALSQLALQIAAPIGMVEGCGYNLSANVRI